MSFFVFYVCPFLLFGGGVLALWMARWEDNQNFLLTRAPTLEVKNLFAGDDAWVIGEIKCEHPLAVPHFGHSCIYFKYDIEELRPYTDSRGRRRKKWETVHAEKTATEFTLQDRSGEVKINISDLEFVHPQRTGYAYETKTRRHSADYEPPYGQAGVMGYFNGSELRNVEKNPLLNGGSSPVIVIRKPLAEYLQDEETAENHLRAAGWIMMWLGSSAILALARAHELVTLTGYSLLYGLGFTLLAWCIYTYNRFVNYRLRCRNAQQQINIELKQRQDVVPLLEKIVKAACAHEKEVLEVISELRRLSTGSNSYRAANNACKDRSRLTMLDEKYPQLYANQHFQRFRDVLQVTEEKLAHARNIYNQSVEEYNTLRQTFPYWFFARLGRFEELPFL